MFLGILAGGLLAAPLAAAEAQQAMKAPRVGFLEAGSRSANQHFLDAFRQGLRDLRYVEGQTIFIEDRWADGRPERFPELIADLIRLKVDVLVVASTPGVDAAKKITSMVPVVFWGVADPVGTGVVASLGHPGGNITGVALGTEDGLAGKWAELLKEAVPNAIQVAVLGEPQRPRPSAACERATDGDGHPEAHAPHFRGAQREGVRRCLQRHVEDARRRADCGGGSPYTPVSRERCATGGADPAAGGIRLRRICPLWRLDRVRTKRGRSSPSGRRLCGQNP